MLEKLYIRGDDPVVGGPAPEKINALVKIVELLLRAHPELLRAAERRVDEFREATGT